MLPELVTYLGTSEKEQITIDVCRNRHMRRNRNAGKNRIVAHDQPGEKNAGCSCGTGIGP